MFSPILNLRIFSRIFSKGCKVYPFWPRFYIVVLGMTFFFFFLQPIYFFPFSIWTFISLFFLDFYFPFLFGLLFPFSIWTFISLFFFDFYFLFYSFSIHFYSFSILSLSLILDSFKFLFLFKEIWIDPLLIHQVF